MLEIIGPGNCQFAGGKCAVCDKAMKHDRVVRDCGKGTKGERPKASKRRPRTDDELKAIHPICRACPHYLHEPTETLDAGVCMLRVEGCGSCKTLERFRTYLRAGNGCADRKNARFGATEVVE